MSLKRWRTYSLEYSDLPTMVENVADLLMHLSLNVDGKKRVIPILSFLWLLISVVVYLYVLVFSVLWHVFWRGTQDFVVDTILLSFFCVCAIGPMKTLLLHTTRNRLQKTMVTYLKFDKRICRDSRMYRRLVKNLRVIKRRASAIWLILVFNGVFFCSMPLALPGRHIAEDHHLIYGLEPMFESPNFEIVHLLFWISIMFTVYCAGSIAALMITMTGYIEAQMIALGDEMLDLWDDAQALTFEENQDEDKLRNLYIKQQLDIIAQAHSTNLFLLRSAESIFSNAIAVEFCLLGMALISELIEGIENTYLKIPYAFNQIAMDCFTGQRLMEASIRFTNAVYDCKWENFDVSNMKTVLMIYKNSKEMILKAGGIAELRYTSLMSVIKSIYSTYMALRSTMD